MKWVSLLRDFKEKVGLSAPTSTASSASSSSFYLGSNSNNVTSSSNYESLSPSSREKYNLELDFKRFWEEFRSSTSEKEKEKALNLTVDVFCRLVKQHSNVAQLITMLVETHIFLFVVGRAFVTDIDKLKIYSKTRSLEIDCVIGFFSEDGIQAGSNLLHAVEFLVSGPIDKQSLLDSGIFCCLIHILNAFLGPVRGNVRQNVTTTEEESEVTENVGPDRRLEVEGSIVHIMKALASHPAAAQSLIEDNSLQLLFQMVANGSTFLFSRYKEGLVPLHTIQLHRHAKQILGLLLVNDNGISADYIRKHQLIKVLLMAVKDFSAESGDSAYTMGIVDLLLECVELSYRSEAGGIRLREDIHNAHGYQFLVQFALVLARDQGSQSQTSQPRFLSKQNSDSEGPTTSADVDMDPSSQSLSPTLSRLLDVVVNLSHTGPTNASEDNYKVKDLEAVQMLQDIFLKADIRELQAEVLNRMFKIFSSHLENYMLCQQLRTVPLLILNMGDFPSSFQETILKILEYAVTVVNCIPEQELLSLCCLLQQPITSELKHTVLAFFVKLLSFDQRYKKILREVGVLEVLLDDLKQHKFLLGQEQHNNEIGEQERMSSPSSFKKHLDSKDVILSSPKLLDSGSEKFPLFETEGTIKVAWDCLVSLLRKAEHNQGTFRSIDGVTTVLPFLASDVHRPSVLRVLSCLIIEDSAQAHPDELGTLVDVSKSGIVTSALGSQYKLQDDAKCDIFGAIWRILGANSSAQRVFGEATGFSLILTTLHSFQGDKEHIEQSLSKVCLKVLTYLLRVLTVGVCNNAVNRAKLHVIISSQTLCDLLSESGLICVECEKQIMQLLFELALEIVLPPSFIRETTEPLDDLGNQSPFRIVTPSTLTVLDKKRIYNAGALRVPIRLLLLFSPNLQLEFLKLIEELAHAGSFNRESLTSAGCVELLLETIYPILYGSSSLLSHSLRIIEVLGAYRLSAVELRVIIRYIMQARKTNSACALVDMMERLILMENTASENVSLAPFVEMNMSKSGHSSIQVPLGERSWPPPAGYSFVCWFQYQDFLKSNGTTGSQVLRIFSVGATDDSNNTFNAELYLQEDGTLTLATSNSSSLSFSGLDIDEFKWHHLAVVHSKPNSLAGLFQASVAYVYLNGKLRNTGRLGYSLSPAGKSLQVTIGTPVSSARVSNLTWKIRSCYLFEEVLTPGNICFMYILGRGYRGLFQDTNLLQFIPNQACGGGSMAILDSLETDLALASNAQRPESGSKQGNSKTDHSGIVWDLEILGNLSLQLSGKKLIFALDGTSTEASKASGTLSMVNLLDPMSAAASPIAGIPRFGRLHGDIYVCKQCIIGESLWSIGGITVVLALVEAAESRHILHMVLTLLACALHQNPQNVRDMQAYRGYHLLALLLHPKMSLFDIHLLEIFFQIAACEASFAEPKNLENTSNNLSLSATVNESSFDDLNLSKFNDEVSSVGSHGDMDDFSVQKDAFSHISELDNNDLTSETSNCVVLSNADMVEHVLLDWTVWVAAAVPIQIALLGFLENLVSMHWYRNHNLTILRKINLIQHLLVTLQRGDVEVPVLEKLVVLLGVILEDGFVVSELEHVVRFVIMTFDPPELISKRPILREAMGKHIIVRNMLLEMLIDLLVTITSEELLEQWHKIVSSKLITYFLDEAVHPTTMRWIMTLVGVCLTSSPTFSLKFRTSGGYQGLMRVLPSFYDSPDIYYILFCLIFGKPVYPRLPEVRLLDFHALIPSDGSHTELQFLELLDSVIAMAKSTFDRLSIQTMLAYESGNLYQVGAGLLAELTEMTGELQGEALMHKTYAARLMGGEASAPAAATSVLRFMVDLAKMCPPFSVACRRAEFLEHCVDLYFSCVRSAHAVKMAKMMSMKAEDKNQNDCDETASSHNSLPLEQEQYSKTSIGLGSFPPGQASTSSEDIPVVANNLDGHKADNAASSPLESPKPVQEVDQISIDTFKADNTALFPLESHKPVEEVDQASTAASDGKEVKADDEVSSPLESHKPVQEADHVSNAISEKEFKVDSLSPMESHKPAQEADHVSNATSDSKEFKVDSSSPMESRKPVQKADHVSNATSCSKEFKVDGSSPMESHKSVQEADHVSNATSDSKELKADNTASSPMESRKPVEEADQLSTATFKEINTASSPMDSHKPVEEVDQVSTAASDGEELNADNTALLPVESHNPVEVVDHVSTATFKADNATLSPLESRKPVEEADHVSNATSHSKEFKADASSPVESHKPVQEAVSKEFKADDTAASQLESHKPVEEADHVCNATSDSNDFKVDDTALSPLESHKPVEEADSKELKADDTTSSQLESHKPVEEADSKELKTDDTASSQLESHKPVKEVDQVHTATSDGKELKADNMALSPPEPHKPVAEANQDQASTATSDSKEFSFHDLKITPVPVHQSSTLSPPSLSIFDSPFSPERSTRVQQTPSSSPMLATKSWRSAGNLTESRSKLSASPSMASSVSMSEFDAASYSKSPFLVPNTAETNITINPRLLLDADDSGYGGGPCSAGASAVLDFMAEVLADIVTGQIKAATVIENILESVRLYVDAESVLVFQGLCLGRLMNFVERRLLRDDEEDQKKLDKSRWSSNLDALCVMIVDRVYMGAFPEPAGVLKTMEFLLSILQMANKDRRLEQTAPPVRGLLSIGRGTKQLDAYILAMLKNMNRIIMYCFLPSFLISIREDEFLSRLGLQIEPKKRLLLNASQEDGVIDICRVLQLLVAHRRIIFCPSNLDNDLNCCLCINLISLLHDQRQNAQNLAVEILKHLLWHRKTALVDLLVTRPNQGPVLDALHGFDKLINENVSSFFEWLHTSEQVVSKTLEQGAAIVWVQYISGSVKFPGVRIKAMDSRRKKEMNRKLKETRKFDLRHWDQVNERRSALELVRDQLSTELRVLRQDKYGWVLHAESEWQTHLQQLVHERGIFPVPKSYSSEEPEWQLCPIEGPYRMRKKMERCKLKVDTIQTILNGEFEGGELSSNSDAESNSYSNLMSYDAKQESSDEELFEESIFKESDGVKDVASIRAGWIDDRESSIYEASIYSAAEFSVKSNRVGGPKSMASIHSLKRFALTKSEDVRAMEDKLDKELLSDNGEHLIRPYLEHHEKIKFKYNCERVVALDKHDGIFLIGELCLYVIENFYIDDSKCICEKESEDELSVIDQALGVKKDLSCTMDSRSKSTSSWGMTVKAYTGGRAWAYNGGAWGRENAFNSSNVPHLWRMWKLNSVHEILKRDYQLRPVAVEIFSMDGNNDLLVFHKKEREEIFRNLVAMNLPRNSMLDTTISGSAKQESTFKIMAKSFPKRWQNGEISNFQYLMHLNTLAGRGYSDLTQYPVFPWVLADYENENLDFTNPETFRKLDKPVGCQSLEGEEEFRKRFDSWDDPEIPKFHYGSHYSSAGIVLHYLIRLPPFSAENQKLQGGQFDHADRLFNNIRDTWLSAAGKNNTSDVKELIPEFFYMPEFLLNKFDLDLGEKQSGEKVGDVGLPPWAKGSATEFIKKHREALESDYVSENLHHWIDLIFGYKQRGKPAEEAVNVFYHYTYEGSVDIDAVADPAMKAAILAQINNFGQTPKQLFQKPHAKRRTDRKPPRNPLKLPNLVPHEIRKITSSVSQIVTINERILIAGPNNLIKPRTYTKYVAWGFPDRSLRFMSYDQDRLLSTHENLHGCHQIHCAGVSHDGQVLVTGGDDGVVCVWRIGSYGGPRAPRKLNLEKALCAHTAKITRLYISQPYMMVVSGSDDCTVIIWDLSTLVFLRQLPEFPGLVSAIYVNDLTGEIVTGAGVMLSVWSINGDCLAVVNASQLPSDFVVSVTSCMYCDWMETNWYVSGHQSGAIKVWQMVHNSTEMAQTQAQRNPGSNQNCGLGLSKVPDYTLILQKVLKGHKHPVSAVHLSGDMRLLLSGDSGGHLFSWTLPDETLRNSVKWG